MKKVRYYQKKVRYYQRFLICLIALPFMLSACNDDPTEVAPEIDVLTDGLVVKGLSYGPESRQFVDLYKAASPCPTPIYFDAHGNGGTTVMPTDIVDDLNALGITVIAWESLTAVKTAEEVATGWDDADLMFQWVMDNAETYNLDVNNMIIGGSSRGSILSWKFGHSNDPGIKGLYMYNALPSNSWGFGWYPPDDVTSISPPVQFVYKREPGCSTDPIDPDIHDPNNGFTIIETYETLGIGDQTDMVHSIGETANSDKYQFLVDFALSVIDTCSQ